MGSPKTAFGVVQLNLFSLLIAGQFAYGDAFYDAVKKGGKYDSAAISTARQQTIEKDRAAKMNALTQSNPDFIPLNQATASKPLSLEEKKALKAKAELEPPGEDDKEQAPSSTNEATNNTNLGPIGGGRGAPSANSNHGPGSNVKVTTDDPDEVSFDGKGGVSSSGSKSHNSKP